MPLGRKGIWSEQAPYNLRMQRGLVLFAHGARDPRWRQPFERLAAKVGAARPDLAVRLAFLEMMAPDLMAATDDLVAAGCRSILVVPIFLGQGGHVRAHLPAVVAQVRARHPAIYVELRTAIGEDETVLAAIAQAVLTGVGSATGTGQGADISRT